MSIDCVMVMLLTQLGPLFLGHTRISAVGLRKFYKGARSYINCDGVKYSCFVLERVEFRMNTHSFSTFKTVCCTL